METLSRHVAIVRVIRRSWPILNSPFPPQPNKKKEQCQFARHNSTKNASYVLSVHVLTVPATGTPLPVNKQ
jgi:hypothetical protein